MKKVILLFAIILCAVVSMAQKHYTCTVTCSGVKNTSTGKYIWRENNYLAYPMDITIKGKIVLVSDDANSTYVLGKKAFDSKTNLGNLQVGWYAKDEKDRGCIFKIVVDKETSEITFYVAYEDYIFMYQVEEKVGD